MILEDTLNNLSRSNQTAQMLVFNSGTPEEYVSILCSIVYIMAEESSLLTQMISVQVCDFTDCTNDTVTIENEIQVDTPLIVIIVATVVPIVLLSTGSLLLIITIIRRKSTISDSKQ